MAGISNISDIASDASYRPFLPATLVRRLLLFLLIALALAGGYLYGWRVGVRGAGASALCLQALDVCGRVLEAQSMALNTCADMSEMLARQRARLLGVSW